MGDHDLRDSSRRGVTARRRPRDRRRDHRGRIPPGFAPSLGPHERAFHPFRPTLSTAKARSARIFANAPGSALPALGRVSTRSGTGRCAKTSAGGGRFSGAGARRSSLTVWVGVAGCDCGPSARLSLGWAAEPIPDISPLNVTKPISPRTRSPGPSAHRADPGFGPVTSVRNSVRSVTKNLFRKG